MIYFAFSDECGSYYQNMTDKSKRIHPYYLRATLIMKALEWKKLNTDFRTIKAKYGIPLDKEMKWSYIWSVRSYQINGHTIPANKPFKYLENTDYQDLIKFTYECLGLLNNLTFKKNYFNNITNS